MTTLPPDPDPDETVDVLDGGGVDPGDTPPDSASTSQSANKNPPPQQRSPIMIAALIAVGVLFAIFLTVAVLYFLQVVGLMDRW